ncbi:MAG: glycosyltransferase [Patescibacteria group bacterium]
MKKISVIIPAHNEENEIPKTLNCVLEQGYENIEIIVSNDGSTDKTEEIVQEFMKKDKRIMIISSPTGHSGAYARNKGATIATGKILVFLDSDARIGDGFLKKVAEGFEKFDVQAVTHPKKDTYANFLSKTVALMARNSKKLADKLGKIVLTEINEFNLFIFEKKAFEEVGGYDDKVLYYDDTDITRRFYAKGYKALLEPEIMLYSAQPEDLGEFYRRYKWSGEGIAAMKDKKERLRETAYLSLKFLFILAPIIVLFFNWFVGLILLIGFAIITVIFNFKTNKNFIWSILMTPITYLKNIIEFGSMIWHYFFPRKNTRD